MKKGNNMETCTDCGKNIYPIEAIDDGMIDRTAAARIAEDLAEFMARENPRFDRVKFLEACGL